MRLYKISYTLASTRERHSAYVGSKADAGAYRAEIRTSGLHVPASIATEEVELKTDKTSILDFINKVAAGTA